MTDTIAPVCHAKAEIRTEDIVGIMATLTMGGYRMVALPCKAGEPQAFAIEDMTREAGER